jgi:oligoendopeptidase F
LFQNNFTLVITDLWATHLCGFISIPGDIRILYKKETPYFDFQACFHETGHAMHASSVDAKNKYSEKYRIPMGVAGVFSILLERLTKNGDYLSRLIE